VQEGIGEVTAMASDPSLCDSSLKSQVEIQATFLLKNLETSIIKKVATKLKVL
jgi:hypothetical protein